MTRRLLVLALLASLSSCECVAIEGYPPINEVCERPSVPFASDTATTTIGTNLYTSDLDEWLTDYPEGSVERDALLRHEQVHARRQFDYQGLPGEMALWTWIARYTTDHEFMWAEEQLGYYAGIKRLQAAGRWSHERTISQADAMSSHYRTVGGKRMVSFDVARSWIQDVLQGRWAPQ